MNIKVEGVGRSIGIVLMFRMLFILYLYMRRICCIIVYLDHYGMAKWLRDCTAADHCNGKVSGRIQENDKLRNFLIGR